MAIEKIVSFDPASTRNLGWAKIELGESIECQAGTFVMPDVDEVWQVYWPMYQSVTTFLGSEKPDLVVIEKTSAFRGGFVTGQVSHCMGVIFAACQEHNIKIEFAFPTTVKLRVAGHGKCTKSQIKKAVCQLIFNLTGHKNVKYSSDHAYDSVANILYYLIDRGDMEALESYPWLTEKQMKTRRRGKKHAKK